MNDPRYAALTDPDERARYRFGAVGFCATEHWAKEARRGEQVRDDDDPVLAEHAAPSATPEAQLALAELLARFAELLNRDLAHDYNALRVMELHVKGTEEPAEQAEVLCIPPSEIYNAWRRVRSNAARIRASLGLAKLPLFAGAQPGDRAMVAQRGDDVAETRSEQEEVRRLLAEALAGVGTPG